MCPSSPGSSVTGRDWSPRPPVSPAWALSSACAPAGRICAHRQGFQRQGARLGRGEDLDGAPALAAGSAPPLSSVVHQHAPLFPQRRNVASVGPGTPAL